MVPLLSFLFFIYLYVYVHGNLPFLSSGILSDLFPGVCIPEHDYGVLHSTIVESLVKRNLQPLDSMTKKVEYKWKIFQDRHFSSVNSSCRRKSF